MTAIFYDRINGCNRKFDQVVKIKFETKSLYGSYKQVAHIFRQNDSVVLTLSEYRLLTVY